MGYRSNVAITLYKKDFESLVKKAAGKTNYELDLIKSATLYEKSNEKYSIITMVWNYIKWYDDYEDVEFIMSFIRGNNTQYHFIRIGEEPGDIEEESNEEHWMLCESVYIETRINVWSAGNEVDIGSSVNKILQDKITLTNETDEHIEEVSEAELLNIISA